MKVNKMRCRLCLVECGELDAVDLFYNGEESNLTKLITKYIHLEITPNDAFSTALCESCFQHINEFHSFILLIEQRQTELEKEFLEFKCILNDGLNISGSHVAVEEGTTLENNAESMPDIENVMIESEGHDDVLLKEEFGFANDINIPNDEDDDNEDNDIKNNYSGNSTSTEHDEDDVPLQTLLNGTENSEQSKMFVKRSERSKPILSSLKKKRGRPRKNVVGEVNLKTKKSNAISEESKQQDEQILKSIRLKCELCEAPANTYNDLRVHFREVHNTKAFVLCCGRRFRRRFVLLDHLRYHLNPEHFKCKICNKVLKSKNCLENHHANLHSDALERKHECKMCGRRFAHVSNLNSHLLTHASARDHICETCNKGFKSASLLKNHVTYVHENKQPFICEICGQKYKFKPAFQRHVAEHDAEPNQLTEECPICKKWFRPNGLRFHMGRHELKDVKCEICGKIVKSKLALKSHKKYWHTMRETLKCTYCEKTFKRSCVLKEHIAMHTGQKDHNCPHCPREFRSRANMYAHIKKIHVEEWRQTQMVRTRGSTVLLEKQE